MPRKPSRKRMGEYIIAGVLSLVVLWLLFLIWGIARKEEIARQAVKETKVELATLKERQQTLEGNLTELSTARGQEATLRQNHGVAKPGEEVIIVVPPKEATTTPEIPFWNRFLGWFGFW